MRKRPLTRKRWEPVAANVLMPPIDPSLLDPSGRTLHKLVDRTGYTVDIVASPGTGMPHRHQGVELVFVHGGLAVWWVGDVFHVLFPGDALVFEAGEYHASRPVHGSYLRTTIHVIPDAFDLSALYRLALDGKPARRVQLSEEAAPRVFRSICSLKERMSGNKGDSQARSDIARIVTEVGEAAARPSDRPVHPVLQEALQYMIEHVESEETVEELAARLYVSKGHLHHLFRASLGCSPVQMWHVTKMERTCRSLLAGGRSVAELAAEAGFATRRGFQRAFKRVTGVSVETYKRRLQEI